MSQSRSMTDVSPTPQPAENATSAPEGAPVSPDAQPAQVPPTEPAAAAEVPAEPEASGEPAPAEPPAAQAADEISDDPDREGRKLS